VTDRDLEEVRYSAMRWNTPLSEAHAELLIDRLEMESATTVLDLGCGWGELLIRAVLAAGDECAGIGVDTDSEQFARGRHAAAERGVGDRVRFVEGEAQAWSQPAERVLCVGASHAWGGTTPALEALAPVVSPGGLLLFGDGYWQTAPTTEAMEIFGDGVIGLDAMVERALADGWHLLSLTTSDQREWDEFESSWRLGRERWLRVNPRSPNAGELRQQLDERVREYVRVYRGVLGFAYLVLSR
jgi:SAM-dependent methyltransferase